MQFDFKLDFKGVFKSKTAINSVLGAFWQKIYKFVFLFLLLATVALAAYVWQKSLYGGQWSEEKKQEYLNANGKGVTLKEGDFKEALEDVKMRKQEVQLDNGAIRDIFKGY